MQLGRPEFHPQDPYLKKKMPGMVASVCKLSRKEAEVGGSLELSGQPARPALGAPGQMRDSAFQNKVDGF